MSDGGDPADRGMALLALTQELVGIHRSLTGDGVRASLAAIAAHVPLHLHEVPTGTAACDWTIPDEWNLRRAVLTGPDGAVIADTDVHPLHVLGHSIPIDVELDLDELQAHLHSLPEQPDVIPFRNSYYSPAWGFCLADRVRTSLQPGTYRAVVDATLAPGHLTYGEAILPGSDPGVVLLTTHTCHPGMANDNASGMAVLAAVGAALAARTSRRWTYHLVFNPGTIGSLVWLSRNEDIRARVIAGITMAGLGDPGPARWKRTFTGQSWVDRVAEHVLDRHEGSTVPYSPWGYDERQYNAPGFRLPVGHLGRTPHGTYPEYHTSADDLDFVTPASLADSEAIVLEMVDAIEGDATHLSLAPFGEPRLGVHGLYPSTGGQQANDEILAMLWVMAQADGDHQLLDAAMASGLPFSQVRRAADALINAGLLAADNLFDPTES